MTEYRNLYVDKRSFTILTSLPRGSSAYLIRADDTRVARNGDTRVAHNTNTGYAREITVKKRSFTVLVNKLNGS